MLENKFSDDNSVSLFELWGILVRGWRWPVGGVALGAMGAALAIVLSQPQYEAVAIAQVGQVGQVGKDGQLVSVPVESPAQAIERMRSGGFQLEAAKASGYQPWIDVVAHSTSGGDGFFSAQWVKNTQLIEIRGRAATRDDAGKIVNALVQLLGKRHAELAAPTIARLNEDLLHTAEKLNRAESELAALGSVVSSARLNDERSMQIALGATIRLATQSEVMSLRQSIAYMKAALAEPASRSATTVENVFVGEKPVAPKKGVIAILGTLAGFLLGVAGLFVWNVRKEIKRAED